MVRFVRLCGCRIVGFTAFGRVSRPRNRWKKLGSVAAGSCAICNFKVCRDLASWDSQSELLQKVLLVRGSHEGKVGVQSSSLFLYPVYCIPSSFAITMTPCTASLDGGSNRVLASRRSTSSFG